MPSGRSKSSGKATQKKATQPKQNRNSSLSARSPSQKASNNQVPKKESGGNHQKTKYSDNIFKTPYMKTFIMPGSTDVQCKCKYCKDPEDAERKKPLEMFVESVYGHIDSTGHWMATPTAEKENLEALIKVLKTKTKKDSTNQRKVVNKEDAGKEANRTYLEFLAFAISQNLSFIQISELGSFIQNLIRENRINHLRKASFDRELISLTTRDCFRVTLLDELKEKLKSMRYSLSIDNSTILAGESFCGLKVKFLEEIDGFTQIQNKIIAMNQLRTSSSGRTMLDIINNKIFDNENIEKNLIGLTHDFASSLTGPNIGLVKLLRDKGGAFFDLTDPCHGLNLTIQNSIKVLPKEIMTFVKEIHAYFSYPQRRAALIDIQEANNLSINSIQENSAKQDG